MYMLTITLYRAKQIAFIFIWGSCVASYTVRLHMSMGKGTVLKYTSLAYAECSHMQLSV